MKRLALFILALLLGTGSGLMAQVAAPNDAGVAFSHWHTIVRDVEATKKFWALFGGTPLKIDGTDVMKLPGVLVFLTQGTPTGGSIGTVQDHVGLITPDGKALMDKLKAAGVKMDGSHAGTKLPGGTGWGYVFTPDDLRVEVLDNVAAINANQMNTPVMGDHVHFLLLDAVIPEASAWYAKAFGATPRQENTLNKTLSGDLPGVRLRFGKVPAAVLPTKGRALDHIGFEVKNLKAFCGKLEASGIKLDEPFSESRHKGFASAMLTDPWGTSIELTEGLTGK